MSAEEKEEKEGGAEEALIQLNPGEGGGAGALRLTDVQIIALAVIGATTGNATEKELKALCGKRPGLAAVIEARCGSSALENLSV